MHGCYNHHRQRNSNSNSNSNSSNWEEKKEPEYSPSTSKASSSYRSTPSSRSSVLERAREYNRRIDVDRSRSVERRSSSATRSQTSSGYSQPRSQSLGRPTPRSGPSTREHAMATVRRDTQQGQQPQRNMIHQEPQQNEPEHHQEERNTSGVPPELLVEALSGHEDGLLAIAEKLMEQYDNGYDVMGEAIIDAFADVQKLFQHVVEAAHMEGAAFEASRRETNPETTGPANTNNLVSPTARHDEFVDQDVKDILSEAIRQSTTLRQENRHAECAQLFAVACDNASTLLPVDSDSRSRLQLSLDRASSMSPDRACAILRYTMDDVLRSGLHVSPLPDPSKRQDMVLPSSSCSHVDALTSLTAELRDILQAPLYDGTPLQAVARRFWAALEEHQTNQEKKAEKLEQKLAQLKGEFLLARAEWEEKLNQATKQQHQQPLRTRHNPYADSSVGGGGSQDDDDDTTLYGSVKSAASRAETVASGVSGLARSLVQSQFNCGDKPHKEDEPITGDLHIPTRRRSRSRSRTSTARSFREYSKSPHRSRVGI